MSAIAKPMIHSTTAKSAIAVNIEDVSAISKFTMPAVGNRSAKYQIIFILKNGQKSVYTYTTSALRDTSYTAIIALVSTAVV